MVKCCKCNALGSCCACVKRNTPCNNCAPGAKHRCRNSGIRAQLTRAASLPVDAVGGSLSQRLPSRTQPLTQPLPSLSQFSAIIDPPSQPVIETPNVQHASKPVIETLLVQHANILDDDADVGEVSDCWKWPVDDLARKFSLLYREVISWRRNLFLLPWCRERADFVQLLADLIPRFVNELAHRPYIWQAVVVAGHVLLQGPFSGSRAAENACTLGARLTI